jgi:Protein of unknown function (DUF3710)
VAPRRKEKRTDRSKIDATPPWETRARDEPDATTGPYDERDAPEDDVARVDLGALLVPVAPGIDLRLEVNEAKQVIAVTLVIPDGHMQVGVFAAPRNEGIWADIRGEIVESVAAQKGALTERDDGPFGVELVGTVRGDGGVVPVRFLGVDGPRWFLRGMLVGAVAEDLAKAGPLLDVLRRTIVVRGKEPLPVRDPVPLRLPKEMAPDEAPGT